MPDTFQIQPEYIDEITSNIEWKNSTARKLLQPGSDTQLNKQGSNHTPFPVANNRTTNKVLT